MNGWNDRLGWRKISQVCQRWRHLIYECASHLGMHIKCTNGSSVVRRLGHLPQLPLFVQYHYDDSPTAREKLRIYHILRLHGRICHIELSLPPSILHKALTHMDGNFPILEHLYLSGLFSSKGGHRIPLTLPEAFLAPNLLHLTLINIDLLKILRVLTSMVTLVTLTLRNIQTSSYFHPMLLLAHLQSLPLLEELTIAFSISVPRPGAESELLREEGAPITLPSLKTLWFDGIGAYLESLAAQISVPLLEKLHIRLFNQTAFVPPLAHLFNLINNTKVFKLSRARIYFYDNEVSVSTVHDHGLRGTKDRAAFSLYVMSQQLNWKIECAAQICHELVPTLSGVEELWFHLCRDAIPFERRNAAIVSAAWHNLLRTFIGVKRLDINNALSEEFSRVLQVDEVGSDPSFLPNLQYIYARQSLFASFIDTCQVVGRPVLVRVARLL